MGNNNKTKIDEKPTQNESIREVFLEGNNILFELDKEKDLHFSDEYVEWLENKLIQSGFLSNKVQHNIDTHLTHLGEITFVPVESIELTDEKGFNVWGKKTAEKKIGKCTQQEHQKLLIENINQGIERILNVESADHLIIAEIRNMCEQVELMSDIYNKKDVEKMYNNLFDIYNNHESGLQYGELTQNALNDCIIITHILIRLKSKFS